MGRHAGAVEFVFVYQREPHARQLAFADVGQPKDLGERWALARRTCEELTLPTAQVWVDGMDDQSRALFGDLPSPAIVIDAGGVIRAKLPWAEPAALGPVTAKLLAVGAGDAVRPPAVQKSPGAEGSPSGVEGAQDAGSGRSPANGSTSGSGRGAERAAGAKGDRAAAVPATDGWLEWTRCATVVAERPQDPQWRRCLDRLLAADAIVVRHWALQQLVARLQQGDDGPALQAAQQQLDSLRREHAWLEVRR